MVDIRDVLFTPVIATVDAAHFVQAPRMLAKKTAVITCLSVVLFVSLMAMSACSGVSGSNSDPGTGTSSSGGGSGSGSGGSGSGGSSTRSAQYLYSNGNSGSVAAFQINEDGTLKPINVTADVNPLSAAKGFLLGTGNCTSSSCDLSLYQIAPATGNLALYVSTSAAPGFAVLDSSASFVYSDGGVPANPNGSVSAFSVATGSFSSLPGSPYQYSIGGGSNPVTATTLLVDPTGKFVYMLMTPQNEHTPSGILAVVMRDSDGALSGFAPNSPGGSGAEGCTSGNLAVAVEQGTSLLFQSCDGSFQSNFYVQSCVVDQATGNILSVNGFDEPQGGGLATGLAADPSGKWLAVTDIFNNNVHVLAIDPTNAGLTDSPDRIFPTGTGPSFAAFDNTGKFLYVLNGGLGWVGPGSNNISAYAFNASTGTLTPLPGSPYTTGQSPSSLVIAQP